MNKWNLYLISFQWKLFPSEGDFRYGEKNFVRKVFKKWRLTMLNKKVRIGIIGGRFGSTFQFHEHPNCIVEAVCDLSPDQRKVLMDTYKCSKSYESFEELLKDKNIDAVAIFTPAPLHARHSIIALKAGKHVMCAVPAVMTIEEAEELKDTVEKQALLI